MQENGYFKVSLLTCTVYLLGLAFIWLVFDNKKVKKDMGANLGKDSGEDVDKSHSQSDNSGTVTQRKKLDHVTT